MPRNQGTSRKGKPKKGERAAGMGRSLQRSQQARYRPKMNGSSRGGGGMAMTPGTYSIGVDDDSNKNKTKSVLEMDDLSDFLHQAKMANREFESQKEYSVLLDSTSSYYDPTQPRVTWKDEQVPTSKFTFEELSVPRRPAWDESTTKEQLEQAEKEAFLEWRRGIAVREEELFKNNNNNTTTVTPFEKNLEVWRQLWRVLERCACLVQIVDGRNPMFYLSKDLKKYVCDELQKPMVLLINKSDFLTAKQRQAWHVHLQQQGWDHVFFSAHDEQQKLDQQAALERKQEQGYDDVIDSESIDGEETTQEVVVQQKDEDEEEDAIGVTTPLSRLQLLTWLEAFAVQHDCEPDTRYENRIQFGMVGFPNVGKSSVINVLMGNAQHAHGVTRVGVASQPGKTKHFQTLLIPNSDNIMLCDCPGLVFPSFCSSTADLIAAGVYPIAQMRDYWPVVELVCQRIPRKVLEARYGIVLPKPSLQELKEERGEDAAAGAALPPPTAEELLTTYCIARSMLAASSGVPDHQRAARIIISDYATGKLLYCHAPPAATSAASCYDDDEAPNMTMDEADYQRETLLTSLQHTKKLRDKLLMEQQEKQQKQQSGQSNVKRQEEEFSANNNDCAGVDHVGLDGLEQDLDLLDMVGGEAMEDTSTKANKNKRGKKHKTMHKHGKKGRKDRNRDPYGCHADPNDVTLGDSNAAASRGLIVNAGKYGRRGYTRPNYAGARNAVQYTSTSSN